MFLIAALLYRLTTEVLMDNKDLSKFLGKLVSRSENQEAINKVWAEAHEELSADPNCTVSIKPLDVSIFGNDVAGKVGSCRLSIFRAGTAYNRERHPNSTQFVFSLEGCGEIYVLEESGSWRVDRLGGVENGALETCGHWTPAGIWHQPIPSKDHDWVVLAFHTATEVQDEFMV